MMKLKDKVAKSSLLLETKITYRFFKDYLEIESCSNKHSSKARFNYNYFDKYYFFPHCILFASNGIFYLIDKNSFTEGDYQDVIKILNDLGISINKRIDSHEDNSEAKYVVNSKEYANYKQTKFINILFISIMIVYTVVRLYFFIVRMKEIGYIDLTNLYIILPLILLDTFRYLLVKNKITHQTYKFYDEYLEMHISSKDQGYYRILYNDIISVSQNNNSFVLMLKQDKNYSIDIDNFKKGNIKIFIDFLKSKNADLQVID